MSVGTNFTKGVDMGYDANFKGFFTFDRPLSKPDREYLKKFAETRRVKRNAEILANVSDPVRDNVGLPIGTEGEFYVGATGFMGQDRCLHGSVIDPNSPPSTQPGLWCQWTPSSNGDKLKWDGTEKFYNYVEWLNYLIDNFIKPWGYTLNGGVKWKGEGKGDKGTINVDDNVVSVYY
jgi:hypothetical protein